jgi:hypothetical protein
VTASITAQTHQDQHLDWTTFPFLEYQSFIARAFGMH